MPNIRMIIITNILDKKFETFGANNPDVSKMISKIVMDTELKEVRQYHVDRYTLFHKYNVYAYNLSEIYKTHKCNLKYLKATLIWCTTGPWEDNEDMLNIRPSRLCIPHKYKKDGNWAPWASSSLMEYYLQ